MRTGLELKEFYLKNTTFNPNFPSCESKKKRIKKIDSGFRFKDGI